MFYTILKDEVVPPFNPAYEGLGRGVNGTLMVLPKGSDLVIPEVTDTAEYTAQQDRSADYEVNVTYDVAFLRTVQRKNLEIEELQEKVKQLQTSLDSVLFNKEENDTVNGLHAKLLEVSNSHATWVKTAADMEAKIKMIESNVTSVEATNVMLEKANNEIHNAHNTLVDKFNALLVKYESLHTIYRNLGEEKSALGSAVIVEVKKNIGLNQVVSQHRVVIASLHEDITALKAKVASLEKENNILADADDANCANQSTVDGLVEEANALRRERDAYAKKVMSNERRIEQMQKTINHLTNGATADFATIVETRDRNVSLTTDLRDAKELSRLAIRDADIATKQRDEAEKARSLADAVLADAATELNLKAVELVQKDIEIKEKDAEIDALRKILDEISDKAASASKKRARF